MYPLIEGYVNRGRDEMMEGGLFTRMFEGYIRRMKVGCNIEVLCWTDVFVIGICDV